MKTDGEKRGDREVKQTERKREAAERQREKQMVAEKRQIETRRDDNTGTASEAQQGVWKAEKCQQKGRRMIRSEGKAGQTVRVFI